MPRSSPAEYGPFHTREEAEVEARKLGFGYLLRYEHMLGPDEETCGNCIVLLSTALQATEKPV